MGKEILNESKNAYNSAELRLHKIFPWYTIWTPFYFSTVTPHIRVWGREGKHHSKKENSQHCLSYSLHSLCRLPSDINELEHLELGLLNMQVFIQTAAFTPLRNNGQIIFSHVAHEEQNINMPSLPNRK